MRFMMKSFVFFGLATLQFACGSAPKPPSMPTLPTAPAMTKGIPTSAYNQFQSGVKALEESPANYTEAIKYFNGSLDTYDQVRTETIAKDKAYLAELDQHEVAIDEYEKKLKEYDPQLKPDDTLRPKVKAQKELVGKNLTEPDYIVARLNLAYTEERLGRYKAATDTYKVLIDRGITNPQIKLAYGRSLLLSGHPDEAIKEFEALLVNDERNLSARNNLAASYLAKDDLKTCLIQVKKVLAIQPKNVPAIINLGLLYLKDKNYDLAELMFKKALKYDVKNARAYSNLGLTYYKTERLPIAVVNFEKAINLDPSMDEARLNLGSVYLDYLDYERALEQFKIVLGRFPEHYQAMVGAADTLYGTNQYQEAVEMYEASIKINQMNPEVYPRLAKLYEEKMSQKEGHKLVAVSYYEKYIELFKPKKDDKVYKLLTELKALIQLEESQKNQPAPAPAEDQGSDDTEKGTEGAEGTKGAEGAENQNPADNGDAKDAPADSQDTNKDPAPKSDASSEG